jgi:hypothetical protein
LKKVLATASCTITVSDPVAKPTQVTAKPTNTVQQSDLSTPNFPTVSQVPGYSKTSKFGPTVDTSFYEKNGPTGSVTKNFSKLTPKIQVQVRNNGAENLNKEFKVFKVSGNCKFSAIPFPVIVPGKTKVVTLKPEFDTQGNNNFKGLALFAIGYEESGKRILFGNLIRVEVSHGATWAKVRFVTEAEASGLCRGNNMKNAVDVMTKDEIQRVKDFINSLDYSGLKLKRYTGKLFEDFKKLKDAVKGVDRVIGCELIKADLIPFTLLL